MSAPSVALPVGPVGPVGLEARARQSLGSSHDAIYSMVASALDRHGASGRLIDVGCGGGGLFRAVGARFASYCGLDAVRYEALAEEAEFHHVDLDASRWPVPEASAQAVVAIETIEHLENPWAFMRHLAALAAPGGLVVVTTPNQLSVLSLMTLVVRRRHSAFQDAHFPAHRTALLESDLARMAVDSGLDVLEFGYTCCGRLPLTPWHYPAGIARLMSRRLSDNLMIVARRPRG